jgi:hypothetical protein
MSRAQTNEFVQAVARGGKRADLIKIVTAPPARYGSGTIDYLKEKLSHRAAALVRGAEPAQPVPGIPEPIMKFLRDEVAPGMAALGHRITKTHDGARLSLQLAGGPKRLITPEALVAEANRLLERDEDDLLALPSAA